MGVSAGEAQAQDRYALAGGCYALKSAATGKFVAKPPTAATARRRAAPAAPSRSGCRRRRSGATCSYGAKRDFMGVGKPSPLPGADADEPAAGARASRSPPPRRPATGCRAPASPSETADWRVNGAGDALRDRPPGGRRAGAHRRRRRHGHHARPRRGGRGAGAGRSWRAAGCPAYPEVALDVDRRAGGRQLAVGRGPRPDRRPHAHDGLRVPRRAHPLRAAVAPLRRRRTRWSTAPTTTRTARARRPRTSSPTAAPRTPTTRSAGRRSRTGRTTRR